MPQSLLKVTNLSVDNVAPTTPISILRNLSFDVAPREVLSVIGRSGSGKSVLGRALIGWVEKPLAATSGSVVFDGQDILATSPENLRAIRGNGIGYVGADPTRVFDPTIAVGTQIAEKFRAVRPGLSRKDALDRVHELFSLVRIPEARHLMAELPSKYSGGMIQRAAIVDAMIGETRLLIADNVTQPLDVTIAAQIIRLFQDLRERLDTAFVFISSSVPTVKDFADRILVLEQGEVVESGATADLIKNPATKYSKNLISQSPRIWGAETKWLATEDISADQPAALSVKSVEKTYRVPRKDSFFGTVAVKAVRGADFDVFPGESLAIVGESGCGKSTLMRLLTWLEQPDNGSVEFYGQNVGEFTARQRFELRSQLQLVLQDPYGSIPAHWTIGRTISEALRLHSRLKGEDRRKAVENTMEEVGLDPALYDKLPSGLSAGQRQRINVARALVLEPKVLLLDETLSALDPMEQTPLIELFRKLQRDHSITLIFISHDLALVRRVAAQVAVMYLGRVVEFASNNDIFNTPLHPYTRALLSAAPTLETSPYNADECLVDGEPPSPINLPKGCVFGERCPVAQNKCLEYDPMLRQSEGRSQVACHYPLSGLGVAIPNNGQEKINVG